MVGCGQRDVTNDAGIEDAFDGDGDQSTPDIEPSDILEIIHVNVGQGDGTIIIGPNGTVIVVDCGPNRSGDDVARELRDRRIQHVDHLIITHWHIDHYGGVDDMINSGVEVLNAYSRGGSVDTVTYQYTIEALATTTARFFEKIEAGTTIDLGNGAEAVCTISDGKLLDGRVFSSSDENDRSVGIYVYYKGFDYHVSGDLGGGRLGLEDMETPLSEVIGNMDVIRLNHHGSNSSSNINWINNTRPEVVVMSLDNNSYGYPHEQLIDRLTGYDTGITVPLPVIYQTGVGEYSPAEVLGTFSITTDGNTYRVEQLTFDVDE
jgi:beta-lactamase superfamily II metal-dependent hydrolase